LAGLFGWGARRPAEPPAPATSVDITATSIVLPRFLHAVSQRPAPVLLDLGPVVGANVAFLGEQLGCRLLVGDMHRDLAARNAAMPEEWRDAVIARLAKTVAMPLDGVLCWDLFDYFDRGTAQAVAVLLTSRLAPGGVVHGLFGTTPGELRCRTRYVIHSASALTCRQEPAPPVKRGVLSTRDLAVIFAGMKVTESVLLKNQRREILLRKA